MRVTLELEADPRAVAAAPPEKAGAAIDLLPWSLVWSARTGEEENER